MNKHKLLGKNILELGSGVGLTGLTIVNYCEPKTYYFSDCHPLVLNTLEENVKFNLIDKQKNVCWKEIVSIDGLQLENTNSSKKIKVCIKNLNWEEIKTKVKQIELDLVIAADILYDSSNFEALASGLNEMIHNTVEYAIVVATIRNKSTVDKFLNILGNYSIYLRYGALNLQFFYDFSNSLLRMLFQMSINFLFKKKMQQHHNYFYILKILQ